MLEKTTAPLAVFGGISVGNILLIIGMCGSVLTGVWQGGKLEATLNAGIALEKELRENDRQTFTSKLDNIKEQVNGIQTDLRGIRDRVYSTQNERRGHTP